MIGMSERRAAEEAYRFLRGHSTGELRFDEQFRALRYVVGPAGRLIAPVMYAALGAIDTVLFVPRNAEGAMEIQVTPTELDPDGPDGAVADRWRIYHGEPHDPRWAAMQIDAARYGKWVIDGPALVRPNPLAADEARLCRVINGDRHRLARACKRVAGADVEHPTLVGVDPLGFDVRRRFDVVRLPAPEPMKDAETVEREYAKMAEVIGDG